MGLSNVSATNSVDMNGTSISKPLASSIIVPQVATGLPNQRSKDGGPHHGDDYEEIREQDRYLPIANIARIMKNTLPDNAKIAKDSKETVQGDKPGGGGRAAVVTGGETGTSTSTSTATG